MTQKQALKILLSRENVFLTGAPGAGKTFVLNEFIQECESIARRIAVTASTGIAASHIGGTTIHSWSGLGIMDSITKDDLRRLKNNSKLKKRYNQTDVLVIDEISMLHGARLDMVNAVAKHMRDNEQPFGGMQVILVGDLFQLPPVSRNTDVLDFAHLSYTWGELDLNICYLTEQHRQAGTDELLGVLQAMREDNVTHEHMSLLKGRIAPQSDIDQEGITRLYSHNVDVDNINLKHLDALPGETKTYKVIVDGDKWKRESLLKNILAPMVLDLKVGAEVMFVANNFQLGFFNGTRGRVTGFKKGEPVVKLANGRTMTVERHTWTTKEDDRVVASVEQIPLRLAWAITIHKSQGMSLDAAQVDLSRAFTPGMGYVALSRVRSLDGLYLQGINEMAISMHDGIFELDAELRAKSAGLV